MLAVLGPSEGLFEEKAKEDSAFLWPRRKALADGGGKGSTGACGEAVFFGGVIARVELMDGLSAGGGETSARNTGVATSYWVGERDMDRLCP